MYEGTQSVFRNYAKIEKMSQRLALLIKEADLPRESISVTRGPLLPCGKCLPTCSSYSRTAVFQASYVIASTKGHFEQPELLTKVA